MKWMWRELVVGIAAAVVGIAGMGQAEESSGAGQTLAFQVISRQTKQPIAGVSLEIRINSSARREVTNEQGRRRIEYGPQRPDYLGINASGQGLVPVQVAWRGTDSSVKIPGEYILAMEPGTSIGGIIQDEQGRPIEGVTVYLLASSGAVSDIERVRIMNYPVKTDAQGRWRCDIMPAKLDDVLLRLEHPDYISDEMYNTTPKPPMERLRDMTGVMVMKKGIAVTGRVADVNDRPIEGATVSQGRDRFGTEYPSTRTDKEGGFQFRNGRPGEMILTVRARGYSPDLKRIAVQPGLAPVEFRLEQGRTLRGRIVDKAGNPVAGAFVAADTWRGYRSLEWRVDTDAQGRFRWDEAPADEVLIDMGKQGHMSVRRYGMIASDKEYTITMYPLLRIKGRVVDAETGQAIPRFMLYPGFDSGNGQPIRWERPRSKTFTDGAYEIAIGEPRYAHFVRVEAEGYLTETSRAIEDGEGDVVCDLRLRKGAGLAGVIRLPDGQPAAGADVQLCTSSNMVLILNGRAEGRMSGGVSVKTAEDGRFALPPQADEYRFVVVHEKGYADLAGEDLAKSSDVTIRPWGRVEGKVLIGSKPGAGETVRVVIEMSGERQAPRVQYDCTAVADKEGHFVLDRVPAGSFRLCRDVKMGEMMTLFSHAMPVDIRAGETTNVIIGGTGRPVIGKIGIPDAVRDKVDWQNPHYDLTRQGAEGPQPSFGMKLEADGTFRADDVPAGKYLLRFTAYTRPTTPRAFRGEPLASLTHPFTVPDMPGGRSDEALDLGVLELPVLGGAPAGPFLLGRNVPDLSPLKLGLPLEQLAGTRLLLYFFDMGQRPSRNAVQQLARQTEMLKANGVVAMAVQVAKADEAALKAWLQENAIALPVGVMEDGESKARSVWVARSLPWLILTDEKHVVVAEGFGIDELDAKTAILR